MSGHVINPRTILCVGRNYADHAKELGNKVSYGEPFFFLKPPSSLVFQPNPIRLPPGAEVHHEIELAVVLGARAHRLKSEEEARSCVAGYMHCLDLTARNWQNDAKTKGLPWTKAKGCDTFLPCGEFVPKKHLPDPSNVGLKLSINGSVKQSDSTALMIHNVWALLMHASSFMTLEAGDLLLTGTPKGVGPLRIGDEVILEGVGKPAKFTVQEWRRPKMAAKGELMPLSGLSTRNDARSSPVKTKLGRDYHARIYSSRTGHACTPLSKNGWRRRGSGVQRTGRTLM